MCLSMGEYIHVASGEGACGIKRCRERRGTQCRRNTDNATAEELAMETDGHWMVDAGRESLGDGVGKAEPLRSDDRQSGMNKKVSSEEDKD